MTTQHTPGPWTVVDDIFVDGPDGKSIFGGASTRRNDEECKANARLIAATPEMLALLQTMSEEGDHEDCVFKDCNEETPVCNQMAARALLARVEGKV